MRYILAVCIVALLASNAFCEDGFLKTSVYAGVGVMRGHTTYQVGGNYEKYPAGGYFETPEETGEVRSPISELKFPLDVPYASVGAELGLAERFELVAVLRKNVSDYAGQMEDRDWGILAADGRYEWASPDSLDRSSVTDTKVDALGAEVSARFYFNPLRYRKTEFVFYLGGKYLYQKFDITASNLDQWYPSLNDYYGFDVGHVRISGDVLTYEVTQEIPAAVAGLKFFLDPHFSFDVAFGFSGDVTVTDEDHHLRRTPPLVTKADCDGDARLFSISGEVKLFPRCSLGISYDYTAVDTEGIETQYHGEDYVAFIQQKNFSDVHLYGITMEYRF